MLNIIIFCKPIHSGKSTALLNWTKQQQNCYGILMPEIKGLKSFYAINNQEYFEAEVFENNKDTIKTQIIGKYIFNSGSFNKANKIIIDAYQKENDFIIIDEIGRLELMQKGFFESLQFILQSSSPKKNLSLLLVVRDTLLNEVVIFFQIKKYQLIHQLNEIEKLII